MGGGVGELVHTDVIVDHLMEDGVFHFLLRQVEGCADFQHEAIFLHFAEELDATLVAQLSEERAGAAHLDGEWWELPAEAEAIEFIEFGLDEADGWNHVWILDIRLWALAFRGPRGGMHDSEHCKPFFPEHQFGTICRFGCGKLS